MQKLRLSIDDLAVESFHATPSHSLGRRTVRGHEQTEEETCLVTGCGTCYTYEYFCGNSDDGTCDPSGCAGDSCGYPICPETYDATCPAQCHTMGVFC